MSTCETAFDAKPKIHTALHTEATGIAIDPDVKAYLVERLEHTPQLESDRLIATPHDAADGSHQGDGSSR